MRLKIADEVAIGKARRQLSGVAGSADLDSPHLNERNGNAALHLAEELCCP